MEEQDNISKGILFFLKEKEKEKKIKANRLPDGTVLNHGRFCIIKTIASGGYGITYLAHLLPEKRTVVLKEFFHGKEMVRKGLLAVPTESEKVNAAKEAFIREADILQKLNHPNIVHFIADSFFEENGTAYYAMDFVEGETLQHLVQKKGPLPIEDVESYFCQLAGALKYLHSKLIIHYDIKPANIIIRKKDNRPILIDFGAARLFKNENDVIEVKDAVLTDLFAPLEQYIFDGFLRFNPSSDIYSLGASISMLITGKRPQLCPTILEEGMPEFPESTPAELAEACKFAFQPRLKDRPKNVDELMAFFKGVSKVHQKSLDTCVSQLPPIDLQNPQPDKQVKVGDFSFELVFVEEGEFVMGATAEQGPLAYPEEKPGHKVGVNSFWMGKTVVTQKLWQTVMHNNPSFFKGDDLPVEMVSFDDCLHFILQLNKLTGLSFRLPTEAEWEFAARGGKLGRGFRFAGDDELDRVAWFWRNSGKDHITGDWNKNLLRDNQGSTHPVAMKKPNELGLYDMSGNVWEWCSDVYMSYLHNQQNNIQQPPTAQKRVFRGGGWNSFARYCRVSHRYDCSPAAKSNSLGFRLALDFSVS